jgi:hypothetical protein
MRKMFFFVVLLVCSYANAQKNTDAIQKFFANYADNDGFTSITITPKLFELVAKLDINDPDYKEVKKVVSKLKYLNILTREGDGRTLYKEALTKINTSEYEPLMVVKSNEDNVQFLTKTTGDVIHELFMVVGDKEDFALISFVGDIDLKEISKLGKANININGVKFDTLEKVNGNSGK